MATQLDFSNLLDWLILPLPHYYYTRKPGDETEIIMFQIIGYTMQSHRISLGRRRRRAEERGLQGLRNISKT